MGLPPGDHVLGAVVVTKHEDGHVTKTGESTLAGSSASFDECVRNFSSLVGKAAALEASSLHPAQTLGIDGRKGRLEPGYVFFFIYAQYMLIMFYLCTLCLSFVVRFGIIKPVTTIDPVVFQLNRGARALNLYCTLSTANPQNNPMF